MFVLFFCQIVQSSTFWKNSFFSRSLSVYYREWRQQARWQAPRFIPFSGVGRRLGGHVQAAGASPTVVLRAIEIGLRAAVGRFLISREKSGSRSVDFYAVGVWKKRVPGAVQVYSGSSSVDSGGRVVIPHSRACLGV